MFTRAASSTSRRVSQEESFDMAEVSPLVLPSTIECGDLLDDAPDCSGATVVSNCSDEELLMPPASDVVALSRVRGRKSSSPSSSTTLGSNDPITHPVPEFLCHLYTMLRDATIDHLIAWEVPYEDEPDHLGGGIRGIGKIVVLDPESLQDNILGNYYRHSKYASFQRQLNYFGFKKRLHNGKKGKLSPCSYIHEGLSADVESLLGLKRRPPAKKRSSTDEAEEARVHDDRASKRSKKRRRTEKRGKKSSSNKSNVAAKQEDIVPNKPVYVKADDYPKPERASSQPPATAPTSLKELLSMSLPPSDVLFNDEETAYANNGYRVTDNGEPYVHNVDSALVNLAMFY